MRIGILLVLVSVSISFAGNFQAKNDTVPNARYYIDSEDSIRSIMRTPEREARIQLNNTCAWTANCPSAREKKEENRIHVHRSGPRWMKRD